MPADGTPWNLQIVSTSSPCSVGPGPPGPLDRRGGIDQGAVHVEDDGIEDLVSAQSHDPLPLTLSILPDDRRVTILADRSLC